MTACSSGGSYKTFSFSYQLNAGTNYFLAVGSSAYPMDFRWRAPNSGAAPTPPQYFVSYRKYPGTYPNAAWEYSGLPNAIRIEFTCGA